MRKDLYRDKSKNSLTDATIDNINKAIDDLIDQDIYLSLFPILSKNDNIDDKSNFFKSYQISVVPGLNPREYKTISYLAMFFKEKVKYNPKEIVRYLNIIGHSDVSFEDVFTIAIKNNKANTIIENIVCEAVKENIEVNKPFNTNEFYSFEDYLGFSEADYEAIQKISNAIDLRLPIISIKIDNKLDFENLHIVSVKPKQEFNYTYNDGFDNIFGVEWK